MLKYVLSKGRELYRANLRLDHKLRIFVNENFKMALL